jgi:hypothetical protein
MTVKLFGSGASRRSRGPAQKWRVIIRTVLRLNVQEASIGPYGNAALSGQAGNVFLVNPAASCLLLLEHTNQPTDGLQPSNGQFEPPTTKSA